MWRSTNDLLVALFWIVALCLAFGLHAIRRRSKKEVNDGKKNGNSGKAEIEGKPLPSAGSQDYLPSNDLPHEELILRESKDEIDVVNTKAEIDTTPCPSAGSKDDLPSNLSQAELNCDLEKYVALLKSEIKDLQSANNALQKENDDLKLEPRSSSRDVLLRARIKAAIEMRRSRRKKSVGSDDSVTSSSYIFLDTGTGDRLIDIGTLEGSILFASSYR
ncbi:expressed unknown protein [Seminavis robusta]|uniref:Uncharacterized protein n=1 Tax=Seminavis robusta TaxID=568900 RepID=A0A9N8HQJ6_9STRA|nr:expressed unknown protein [Seminavis robusta]|eukprot:Sro991_g228720.1 n/a (218) ;mRNA; f:21437-22090